MSSSANDDEKATKRRPFSLGAEGPNPNQGQRPNLKKASPSRNSFADLDVLQERDAWISHERPKFWTGYVGQKEVGYKGSQCFSRFNRKFYFPQNSSDEFEKLCLTWVLVTILAVLVSIAGMVIEVSVLLTSYTVYGFSQSLLLDDHEVIPSIKYGAYFVFAVTCATFASLAGLMVLHWSPRAEGSGIPDVKAYLNGCHLTGLFTIPACFVKSVGCAFAIGSGLVAGREGPIIHVGAILGACISQGSSAFFKTRLPGFLVKHFRSPEWKRDFAVMGSACGVAAAFVAPMGGVLFAIEEGATVWRQQLTFLTLYGALISAFLTSVLYNYLLVDDPVTRIPAVVFGSYSEDSAGNDFFMTTADFPYVLLIGLIGGAVGSGFSRLQSTLMDFRKAHIRVNKVYPVLEIILVSLIVSACRYWIPYNYGTCIPDTEYHSVVHSHALFDSAPHPARFHCEEGEVNNLALLYWVPMNDVIRWLLHAPTFSAIGVGELFGTLCFYFFGACMVFGIAVPSGLFIPSFIVGAAYGRLVGLLAASVTGKYDLLTTYAFLGSASCLGGMTRVTISVALIACEATQNFTSPLYTFLVVLISKLVADSINIGIYDLVIEKKNFPFLVDELGFEVTT